jgi:pimeloyl-ACP methyl ester carboxylesterase
MVQAQALTAILGEIEKRHTGEPITLVGHSAGGVVARLALISGGQGQVKRLISIAAPHLGTTRAWQAIDATDDSGLLGRVKRWWVKRKIGDHLYHEVQQSRGALADLGPPVPGSLLFWLNSQKHPEIEYVSIIRSAGYGFPGDLVVPAYSQDMNMIPDLRGRSRAVPVAWGHLLEQADANLLVRLLDPGS